MKADRMRLAADKARGTAAPGEVMHLVGDLLEIMADDITAGLVSLTPTTVMGWMVAEKILGDGP
jgi:hypothetical protein